MLINNFNVIEQQENSINSSIIESYEKVTSQLNVTYVFLELLVAVIAIVGNGLVIVVFCRERKLRRKTNYYIVSLATADFFLGLFGIPFAILISIGIPRSCYIVCLLMLSLLLTFCTVSIYHLVLISIDRFKAIIFPLSYCDDKSVLRLELTICWTLGCSIGFLPFCGWHLHLPTERCYYFFVVSEEYQLFRFFAVILIPTTIMLTLYGIIYKVILYQLKREQKPMECCSLHSSSECEHLLMKREIIATLKISSICLLFMICWLPLNICKCIRIFCHSCNVPETFIYLGIPLTHSNSAFNWMIYAYHVTDFRQSILKLIKR